MAKNIIIRKGVWALLLAADCFLFFIFAQMLYNSVNSRFSNPDVSLSKINTPSKLSGPAKTAKHDRSDETSAIALQPEAAPENKTENKSTAPDNKNETFKATKAATIVKENVSSSESMKPSAFINRMQKIAPESETHSVTDSPSQKAKSEKKEPEKSERKAKAVKFSYSNPNAKKVELSGSFTSWMPKALTKKGGKWETTLYMFNGNYTYHFIVDGKRTADPEKPPRDDGDSLVSVVD